MSEHFYNNLAPFYQLIFPDWNASVLRQAQVLDGVIREFAGETAATVLDAACGIGTQSIGLAQLVRKDQQTQMVPRLVHPTGSASSNLFWSQISSQPSLTDFDRQGMNGQERPGRRLAGMESLTRRKI